MKPMSPRMRRTLNLAGAFVVVVLMVVVVWMDFHSSFWQEMVILSGIAAGVLTFFLTALFLERWMARRDHERWLPVTRLALTDLLHSVADEGASDIYRAEIVARTLTIPNKLDDDGLQTLLEDVVEERELITAAMARWADFLASSADVQTVLVHVARLAESLDDVRTAVIEVENESTPRDLTEQSLYAAVTSFNSASEALVGELVTVRDMVEEEEDEPTLPLGT